MNQPASHSRNAHVRKPSFYDRPLFVGTPVKDGLFNVYLRPRRHHIGRRWNTVEQSDEFATGEIAYRIRVKVKR